jgi:hypothetical protein
MLWPSVLDAHFWGFYGREDHQLNGVFSRARNIQASRVRKQQR